MATSSIKIYRTHITPTRNALVDDIEDYLGSLTPTHQDDTFQYLKLGLDLNVVVNVGQSAIANHTLGNYCRIVEDGKIWYYFILNCSWKSANAVELKLSIDSINTFRNDLTWDDKTTIAREHENRLARYEARNTGEAIRIIDKQPEKVEAIKFLNTDTTVNQTGLNYNWYLMYRTKEEITTLNPNSSVECLLFADQSFQVTAGEASYIRPAVLEPGYFYFLTYEDLGATNGTLSDNTTWKTDYEEEISMTTTYISSGIVFYLSGDGTQIIVHKYASAGEGSPSTWTTTITPTTYSVSYIYIASSSTSTIAARRLTDAYPHDHSAILGSTLVTLSLIGSVSTKTIYNIDKTDSRIVKIIKLPYCPVEVTKSGNSLVFDNNWSYVDGLMQLNDSQLALEFENEFYSFTPSQQLVYYIQPTDRSVYASRNMLTESKLYNSDFYTFKYVYDSFTNEIRWENFNSIQWDVAGRPAIDFTFKPTNTINSRFDFYADYAANYYDTQDFEGHLLVNRNNEQTVFSNDYLNYLRTGYNYDKKAKEQSNVMNWVTAGLSLVGAVVSFAASTVTGGVSVAAGVALATSAIAGFAGAASNQASNERQMENRLTSLRAQSTGVAGADDVDLMSYYSDNRMHVITYNTETVQREALYNLFFYCGYAHNAIAIPNLTSRYWFNYIMCKPVFKEEGVTPYNEYIDDIKARYQTGVTVYHHHHNQWDWDQQYENWENYIATIFDNRYDINDLTVTYETTHTSYYDLVTFTGHWSGDTLNGTTQYILIEYFIDELEYEDDDPSGTEQITPDSSGDFTTDYRHQGLYAVRFTVVNTTTPAYTSDPLIIDDFE